MLDLLLSLSSWYNGDPNIEEKQVLGVLSKDTITFFNLFLELRDGWKSFFRTCIDGGSSDDERVCIKDTI